MRFFRIFIRSHPDIRVLVRDQDATEGQTSGLLRYIEVLRRGHDAGTGRKGVFEMVSMLMPIVGLLACLAGVDSAYSTAFAAPEFVIVNGNILTMDTGKPRAEAVAVKDGLILAVGSNTEIEALKGPGTETLDLMGIALIPGFIEAHTHLLYVGRVNRGHP